MAGTQMVDEAATVAGSQVTQSVIHNRLVMICREMGIAMMKTSYSTIFNEGLDFSCVIFNRDGEMIAQAEFCPAQLGRSSTPCGGRLTSTAWRTSSRGTC